MTIPSSRHTPDDLRPLRGPTSSRPAVPHPCPCTRRAADFQASTTTASANAGALSFGFDIDIDFDFGSDFGIAVAQASGYGTANSTRSTYMTSTSASASASTSLSSSSPPPLPSSVRPPQASVLRVPSPAFCDCEFGSHRQLPTPTAPRNNALFIHTGHLTSPPLMRACVRVDPQISESATGSHGTHVRHTRMRMRIMNEDVGRRTKDEAEAGGAAALHLRRPHWPALDA